MEQLHLTQKGEPGAYEPLATTDGLWSQTTLESTRAGSIERNYLLLVSGGLLALASYVGIFMTAWAVWVSETLGTESGLAKMFLLLLPYVAGLLFFGYAYKLNNWPRARRLALIWGAIGLAILIVFFSITYIWKILAAVAPGVLGGEDSDSSVDSDSDSSSDSDFSDSSSSLGWSRPYSSIDGSPRSEITSLANCALCGQPIPGGIGSKCPRCPAVT